MYRIVTIVTVMPGLIQTIVLFSYICSMKHRNIIAFVEAQRLLNKTRKATLCSHAGISTTYYNKLLEGVSNPSIVVVEALLDYFGFNLGVVMRI